MCQKNHVNQDIRNFFVVEKKAKRLCGKRKLFVAYRSRHKVDFIGLKIKSVLKLQHIFCRKSNVCAVTNVTSNRTDIGQTKQ